MTSWVQHALETGQEWKKKCIILWAYTDPKAFNSHQDTNYPWKELPFSKMLKERNAFKKIKQRYHNHF